MKLFIVLEGLSGTGKSTIALILAKKMGAVLYKTPGDVFAQAQKIIEGRVKNSSRFLFFVAGLVQSSAEISSILGKKPVVCDRYLLTTLFNHKAMGVSVEELFPPHLQKKLLLTPDHTFLVTCSEKLRLERMRKRGLTPIDEAEEKQRVNGKILREYAKMHLLEIDNSTEDPALAVQQILAVIKS